MDVKERNSCVLLFILQKEFFLCCIPALGAHLTEGSVAYALYIGAIKQGTQLVVYGTLLDAQAVAQFLGFGSGEYCGQSLLLHKSELFITFVVR